jgi:hypothetical protein
VSACRTRTKTRTLRAGTGFCRGAGAGMTSGTPGFTRADPYAQDGVAVWVPKKNGPSDLASAPVA